MAVSLTPQNAFGYSNQLAKFFGLNDWELQQCSYNGVTFMTVLSIAGVSFANTPGAGVVNNVLAYNNKSKTDNKNLMGTTITAQSATDTIAFKNVVHRIPNSSSNIIENMGTDGMNFTVDGIFVGLDYKTGATNIINQFTNTSNVDSKDLRVFVHPIWGKIENVSIQNIRFVHSSNIWRGLTFRFDFVSEGVIAPVSTDSTKKKLAALFSTIQATVATIASTISTATVITNKFLK
jgi:hypothetical protein